MNSKYLLASIGILVTAIAFGVLSFKGQSELESAPPKVITAPAPVRSYADVNAFLGTPTMDVLTGATKTETFRVDGNRRRKTSADFDGWPITASGKIQSREFTQRLASVLLDESTYLFDRSKSCIFVPGVGFRIWKGQESVEIVLCFECDELTINSRNEQGNSIRRIAEDFDPARSKLVRLAKDSFPKDKQIQKLR